MTGVSREIYGLFGFGILVLAMVLFPPVLPPFGFFQSLQLSPVRPIHRHAFHKSRFPQASMKVFHRFWLCLYAPSGPIIVYILHGITSYPASYGAGVAACGMHCHSPHHRPGTLPARQRALFCLPWYLPLYLRLPENYIKFP